MTIAVVPYHLVKCASKRGWLSVEYTLAEFMVCVHSCTRGWRSAGSRMCVLVGASPQLGHCSAVLRALRFVYQNIYD